MLLLVTLTLRLAASCDLNKDSENEDMTKKSGKIRYWGLEKWSVNFSKVSGWGNGKYDTVEYFCYGNLPQDSQKL